MSERSELIISTVSCCEALCAERLTGAAGWRGGRSRRRRWMARQ